MAILSKILKELSGMINVTYKSGYCNLSVTHRKLFYINYVTDVTYYLLYRIYLLYIYILALYGKMGLHGLHGLQL